MRSSNVVQNDISHPRDILASRPARPMSLEVLLDDVELNLPWVFVAKLRTDFHGAVHSLEVRIKAKRPEDLSMI